MPSRSQLRLAPASSLIERAWYLLTLLIRLGRPARPVELSSKSALDATSLSPDLVEFLFQVPGSPVSLTEGGFVSISRAAVSVVGEFVSRTFELALPPPARVLLRGSRLKRNCGEIRMMYARKRKMTPMDAGLTGPGAKRRLFWTSGQDGDDRWRVQMSPAKPRLNSVMKRRLVMLNLHTMWLLIHFMLMIGLRSSLLNLLHLKLLHLLYLLNLHMNQMIKKI